MSSSSGGVGGGGGDAGCRRVDSRERGGGEDERDEGDNLEDTLSA